jgi:hypothetical protein
MIESEPRNWIWTYRALPEPQPQVRAHGWPWVSNPTFVGRWEHDDLRRRRDVIRSTAAADGRFYPQLPWWDGQDAARAHLIGGGNTL